MDSTKLVRKYKRDKNLSHYLRELTEQYNKEFNNWKENFKDSPSRPPKPEKSKELIELEAKVIVERAREVREGSDESTLDRIKRNFRECRDIVSPTGQIVRIPKHASVEDIYAMLRDEYGFSNSEISGALATLQKLQKSPDFKGLINGIKANGAGSPMKVVRDSKTETNELEDTEEKRIEERRRGDIIEQKIAEIWAKKYKEYAKVMREQKKAMDKSSKNLQDQMDEIERREREEDLYSLKRKLSIAAVVSMATLTLGLGTYIYSLVERTPFEEMTTSTLEELPIYDTAKEAAEKSFTKFMELNNTTLTNSPEVIKPQTTPSDPNFESFIEKVPRIDRIKNQLYINSRMSSIIQIYSQNSGRNPYSGEINSYEQFEEALENEDDSIYTSGPLFYASFARQVVRSMIQDKFNVEDIRATYARDENNYIFNIRYYNSTTQEPIPIEGKVNLTRNEEGKLETSEWHVMPLEVYECLALVGEFSDYKMEDNEFVFDIQKYADEHNEGDVEKAKEELKSRMLFGWENLNSVIKERIREEKTTTEQENEKSID